MRNDSVQYPSVVDPECFSPDPDPAFQVIPNPDPAPGPSLN
jgi:hypothetical protein